MKSTFTRCFGFLAAPALLLSLQLAPAIAAPENLNNPLLKQDLVRISGVVTDGTDGQTIPGAVITDKNKKNLGITGRNGQFSIMVPRGMEITFSMLGYTAYSMTVTGNLDKLSIRMNSSSTSLNEVVVTALGIKREERSLGYATTKVEGEQLTNAISSNWTDALSGKVAGLNLIRSNSGPAGSNKIILRGESNLQSAENEALIVVDGVVINNSSGRRTAISGESAYGTGSDNMPADYGSGLNDINPEDIENVTVLKGPSAAALYGQRGANGAIIITTKSGNPKRKGLGITFNSNTSFESVNRWPELQYEYGQGLDGANYYSYGAGVDGASTSGTSSAYGPKFDGQMFFQYDPVTQDRSTVRTPWVPYENQTRQFFETGQTYTNSVSVDGGTDRTSARFSATNVKNTWITPNTGYGRNTIAMSVNSKVNEKLTVSSKASFTNNQSDNLPGAGYGNQSLMYWYIFWQPNADMNWLKNYWQNGNEGRLIEYPFSSFPENPYAISYEFINRRKRNSITGNVQATYNFTKELSFQVRTSVDMSHEERAQERPFDAGAKFPRGSFRMQNINASELSADFLLRYSKKLKDFEFSATGGGSILRNNYSKDELRADSLTYPSLYIIANAAGPPVSIPDRSRYNINSFYGLFTAGYKDYLYLDVTGRQDWSSVLATPERTDNVGFFYPSASVSVIASELFTLPETFSFLKFRASVAGVGSGGTTPYRTSYTYGAAGGGLYPGSALQNPTVLPNADLKPQNTISYEVGTDVRLFKNRLNLDVALYTSSTSNQLLTRLIDRSAGYSHMYINAGEINNKGIEIALNGTPVSTRSGFAWTASATFTANRNEITSLADSSIVLRTGPVGGGQIVAREGGSMGDLYGRGYQRAPDGQVIYDEVTGVAKLMDDVKYLGNTMPKFRGSLGNEFRYKNLRLNLLFDAQVGAVAHSLMNYKMVEQGKLKSTLPGRYSGIIGKGVIQNADGSFRPNDKITFDIDEYYRSHMGADNAEGSTFKTDYIKFREARFDYTLGPKLTRRMGLQRATVGVYGRDLFIWSPWPMFDPEFGTLSGTDILTGFETAQFPSTRTFGFNLIIGI
jgi:TonB-linked SusC/RagA family outer membrane protein